jgi:DNA polymerase-2
VITRGFILQASYRVQTGSNGARVPVIHVYGRLEDGGAFLLRDDRQRAHFYIRAADVERARGLRTPTPLPTDQHTFAGEPVCRIEAGEPGDIPAIRDRLHVAGIDTFEADVRFAVRYLIERGIKGGCEIEGEARRDTNGLLVFENPTLRPALVKVEPRVFAFDIETDGDRLLAISMFAPGLDEVLIVDTAQRPMPKNATACESEYAALQAFCDRIAAFDPDVITGWNTIDFDFTMLQKIAARVRHPFEFGRDAGAIRIRKPEGYFGSGQASVPGRLVLDGIDLLRGAFVRMEDYSLDAVARQVLGEGKAVHGDVRDRLGEILHNYANDLPAFALYARTDARLAYQIVEKLDLVRLAFAHRIVRLRLFERARTQTHRRAFGARRRFARSRGTARRPCAGADGGLASQRVGVRFQEPVSERDSHVQHRSAVVCRGAARGRGSDRNARRQISARAGDPAAPAR